MVEAFDLAREPRLRQVLDALGYALREPPPPHARLDAAGDGIRLTLYASGKLVLQGKRADEVRAELAAFELFGPAPAAASAAAPGETVIGSDETGKGDYFGPLVVAAVRADPEAWARLRELGVRDSKTIADGAVREMAAKVKRAAPHAVVVIGPAKYNQLYPKFRNVNTLLAWAHARAIEDVLEKAPGADRIVTDQFAADRRVMERALLPRGREVRYEQRPRAEDAEPAVAAASVIARAEFLDRMGRLSEQFGMKLEKGASSKVEECGRAFVRKHGREKLPEVAKMHFQTTGRVIGAAGSG